MLLKYNDAQPAPRMGNSCVTARIRALVDGLGGRVHAKNMAADQSATFFPFERAADALREREFARLADAVAPTLEALRSLTPGAFRTEVALMLERLGHEVITDPGSAEFVVTREGRKSIVACARPSDVEPVKTRDLARLHAAIINANAETGFYVTTCAFTPEAEEYAATAPIRLVDGNQLAASMKRSREGMTLPETYRAMCRQCGEIVEHRFDRTGALPCANGHPVAPTIARAPLFRRQPLPAGDAKPEGQRPEWRRTRFRRRRAKQTRNRRIVARRGQSKGS